MHFHLFMDYPIEIYWCIYSPINQCFRNCIGTSAFADVNYFMANVEAFFCIKCTKHQPKCCYWPMLMNIASKMLINWVIIGSDYGLTPVLCQAIASTNYDLSSVAPSGNFSNILILKNHTKWFWKCHLPNFSHFWRPQYCISLFKLTVNNKSSKLP